MVLAFRSPLRTSILPALALALLATPGWAQPRSPKGSFELIGPTVEFGAMQPYHRKWYRPQELFYEFGWRQWEYSNYAKEQYMRYVDINLEGFQFYDTYGNYITRGWKIYDWEQEHAGEFGSRVFKNPRFNAWFNSLVVAATSKGQYYTAITISDEIRTTLTPLTFSKPTFNGVQWDFLADKYELTLLLSRTSDPGLIRFDDFAPPETASDFGNLLGLRGTSQVGDFLKLGATYVSGFTANSVADLSNNSLAGILSQAQNSTRVSEITVRIEDDSPEDGIGGGVLISEQIIIDGRRADIAPLIRGGTRRSGRLEASGGEQILLIYDLSQFTYFDDEDQVVDIISFRKVEFELVLANDYRVAVSSNVQLNRRGDPIFLQVARAKGNVRDGTNMRVVAFEYGLPTGNEVFGATLDLVNLGGFRLQGETAFNRRHRRFPNPDPEIGPTEHELATDKSEAFFLIAEYNTFPWSAYGEVYSLGDRYSTSAFLVDDRGELFFDDASTAVFEFVDDNDDQDRFPDWRRRSVNQRAGNDRDLGRGIFPGLDENNDFVSDFNQNRNFQPDYVEPFLRHGVDPPEFLFGMDMNNNTVVDRFEDDELPDYPYKVDRQGFNVNWSIEILPAGRLWLGRADINTISSARNAVSSYAMFIYQKDLPQWGRVRVFDMARWVEDDIRDDLLQWVQEPNAQESLVPFDDPLAARDTFVNTLYLENDYNVIPGFRLQNRLKYEVYNQRREFADLQDRSTFLGVVNRANYTLPIGDGLAVEPRIKSMYLYDTGFKKGARERHELQEIVSMLARVPALDNSRIEAGMEYLIFQDFGKEDDDLSAFNYVVQFTSVSDYQGYRLISEVGMRQGVEFKDGRRKANALAFVRVFAGLE